MHSCISFLLFIFSTLSSASDLAPLQGPSKLAPPSPPTHKPTFCFSRYKSYWDATQNNVFFHSPTESQFNFTIATKYLKFYPRTLAQWLEVDGFRVANASSMPDAELCGWMFTEAVIVDGIVRGTVGYKYSGRENDTDQVSLPRVPRHHIPAHMHKRLDDETLHKIEAILRNNSPDADIYYFKTIMLGTACGTLGFAIVFYGLMLWSELQRRTRQVRHDAEDIELDQIKVHDLSGSGMQRMDTDSNGPKYSVERVAPVAAASSVSSVHTNVADPPPIYSVDGAGRSSGLR